MIELSQAQLRKFRDEIHQNCGIWFSDSRLGTLQNRLAARFKARDVTDPDRYMGLLRNGDDRSELEALINLVAINETYFFRTQGHFDYLREVFIPEKMGEKIKRQDRRFKIWSAGCSTGEEAYSAAIAFLESISFSAIWDIETLGTDISTRALLAAEEGVYGNKALQSTPENIRSKYFEMADGGLRIKEIVRQCVTFEYLNLHDADYPTGQDVIFCRNVLLYFKDEERRLILEKMGRSLNEGGALFLGGSEFPGNIENIFEMVSHGEDVCFRKRKQACC